MEWGIYEIYYNLLAVVDTDTDTFRDLQALQKVTNTSFS